MAHLAKIASVIVLVAGSLTAASQDVTAASRLSVLCGSRDAIHAQLERKYGELPVSRALLAGRVLEVLASRKGTWTMTMTTPAGASCIVATGEAWQQLQQTFFDPQA